MNRINGLSLTVFISLINYSFACSNPVNAEPASVSNVLSILLTGDVPTTNKSEGHNVKK